MIKVGQLVRIKGFSKNDWNLYSPYKNHLIGQTGRFISWRDTQRMLFTKSPYSEDGGKSYIGDFEYDPDPLNENELLPAFSGVIVELVEEQNERE